MGKRNKIRYVSHDKPKRQLTISGTVYLLYEDAPEDIAAAANGDMLLSPENKTLHTTRQGDYRNRGYSGYFKAEIYDGKKWLPMRLAALFPQRQHYFGKSEHPIDIFERCGEMIVALAGQHCIQTYREHFTLVSDVKNHDDDSE